MSDEQWQTQLDLSEARLIEMAGCEVVSSFVNIEMDGKPFKIRKYEIGKETDGKKTLVWAHGFGGSGAIYADKWKELSERYRLIYFDCFSFG